MGEWARDNICVLQLMIKIRNWIPVNYQHHHHHHHHVMEDEENRDSIRLGGGESVCDSEGDSVCIEGLKEGVGGTASLVCWHC